MSAHRPGRGVAPGPAWLDRETDYPFESQHAAVEGNRVHYVDEGSGPTLLFLHGNPLWSFYFRRLVKCLRGRFRCVALDYPGYGLSEAAPGYGFRVEDHARIVGMFVRELGLTGVTLVAHDAGGPIGLRVAVDHRPRFRALAISDSFAWPLSEDPKVARMLRLVSGRAFGLLLTRMNFLPRVTVAVGIKGVKLSPSERAAYLGPFLARRKRSAQRRLFQSYVDDRGAAHMRRLREDLAGLRDLPTLILFGAGDPVAKLGFPEKFARLLPRHRTVLIEGQDHFPHDGAGPEIARILPEWWTSDVATAGDTPRSASAS